MLKNRKKEEPIYFYFLGKLAKISIYLHKCWKRFAHFPLNTLYVKRAARSFRCRHYHNIKKNYGKPLQFPKVGLDNYFLFHYRFL